MEKSKLTKAISSLAASRVRCLFDDAVMAEAGWNIPSRVRPEDLIDRADLRDKHFLTIDPPSARDFDDALTAEPLPGGRFLVWVAIADVSHYIRPGSAIDLEARERGFSVYLPDRVIPMLPEELSNRICSLVPRQDRLAMAVRLEIGSNGAVERAACMAAVIRSRERLTYGGVAAALAGDLDSIGQEKHRQHMRQLATLAEAAERMRSHRARRGVLGFDFPESKLVFDKMDPSKIVDVVAGCEDPLVKTAHSMVEEMMLAANEAVGGLLKDDGRQGIWRIHPPPSPESISALAARMSAYGVKCDRRKLRGRRGLSSLINRLTRKKGTRSFVPLVLKAMSPAGYSSEPMEHFGLASKTYLHFTSPIRRYADLQVHREAKRMLRDHGMPAGGCCWGGYESDPADMEKLARHLSEAEREASKLERKSRSVCVASLMEKSVGQEFFGTVSGLAEFGFFVNVGRPAVEGVVRLRDLGDWFSLDEGSMSLKGKNSGRAFKLGDKVRVRVSKVDLSKGHVDFSLVKEKRQQKGKKGKE